MMFMDGKFKFGFGKDTGHSNWVYPSTMNAYQQVKFVFYDEDKNKLSNIYNDGRLYIFISNNEPSGQPKLDRKSVSSYNSSMVADWYAVYNEKNKFIDGESLVGDYGIPTRSAILSENFTDIYLAYYEEDTNNDRTNWDILCQFYKQVGDTQNTSVDTLVSSLKVSNTIQTSHNYQEFDVVASRAYEVYSLFKNQIQ